MANGTRNTSVEPKNIPDYEHGTLVASIISQLVSSQTHILPFKIAPQHISIYNLVKSLKMISEIKEISLVNISWNICQLSGLAADMMRDTIKNLTYKGKMIIASAGNKSSLSA